MEFLQREEINVPVMNLGIPDEYIEAASHQEQLAQCGLDRKGIISAVRDRIGRIPVKSIKMTALVADAIE